MNLASSRKNISSPLSLTLGNLEVRLARSEEDLRAAQRLRYQVFYEEMGANPTARVRDTEYDQDEFDAFCDHLLVIDRTLEKGQQVVGTYRLLRRSMADKIGKFYTASEYDISTLLSFPGEILELGRSCVKNSYRTRPTMQLLWRGIGAYATLYGIDLMFGCASFPGIDIEALKKPLSYLHYYHLAPKEIRPIALPHKKGDFIFEEKIKIPKNLQEGLALLPPLIKGYIRVGGFIGEGAVIDTDFNTTDVCIVLQMNRVAGRYDKKFRQSYQSEKPDQKNISPNS